MAPLLARAAVAAGVHAVFMEVHDEPERARSDSAVQLPLHEVESLLARLTRIHQVSSTHSDA